MYVVLTFDEFSKLKESSKKLEIFVYSLNHELELKAHEIGIAQKTASEDVVNNLTHEYSGMLFVKHILTLL